MYIKILIKKKNKRSIIFLLRSFLVLEKYKNAWTRVWAEIEVDCPTHGPSCVINEKLRKTQFRTKKRSFNVTVEKKSVLRKKITIF